MLKDELIRWGIFTARHNSPVMQKVGGCLGKMLLSLDTLLGCFDVCLPLYLSILIFIYRLNALSMICKICSHKLLIEQTYNCIDISYIFDLGMLQCIYFQVNSSAIVCVNSRQFVEYLQELILNRHIVLSDTSGRHNLDFHFDFIPK